VLLLHTVFSVSSWFCTCDLNVLKASVPREKLSCKEAFRVLGTTAMLCFSSGEDHVFGCCACSSGLALSAELQHMFFFSALFLFTLNFLMSQKYFHMILLKLKYGRGKLCFFLVLCQKKG